MIAIGRVVLLVVEAVLDLEGVRNPSVPICDPFDQMTGWQIGWTVSVLRFAGVFGERENGSR